MPTCCRAPPATDTLVGGAGNDTLDGGAGSDTANYASAAAAVTSISRPERHPTVGGIDLADRYRADRRQQLQRPAERGGNGRRP